MIRVFKNQDEFNYFRLYCEEIAPRLSYSSQTIWQQLLLQAGQDQAFIRHAIISIGALTRSLKTMGMGIVQNPDERRPSIANDPERLESTKVYTFALEQYEKFLQGVKSHLSSTAKEKGRRMALIACLLVVCIETIQFHFGNSLHHARSGLALFEEITNGESKVNNREISSSSTPDIIEDVIVQQFHRMELQVMAGSDTQSPSSHWGIRKEEEEEIRKVPKEFATVDQARLFLEIVMRRTYHYMNYVRADRTTLSSDVGTLPKVASSSVHNLTSAYITPRQKEDSGRCQNEHEVYHSENRRWSQAFEPLYHSALRNTNQKDSIRILLLKIHSLTTRIQLAGHVSNSEMIYDNFKVEFEKIVSLGKVLLNNQHVEKFFAEGSFSLDLGLIYCLTATAISCRDRHLRREAIALLSSRSWREAQWGSETCTDVAKWILEVEEDGVETEHIPEWARARLSSIDANLETKTAHLYCVRGVGDYLTHKDTVRYWGDMGG